METYFLDALSDEERDIVKYIPTVNGLMKFIERYGDRPALSTLERGLTYEELLKEVARKRAMLDEKNIKKGGHVAIFDKTTIEAIVLFLAVTTSGRVAVNLPSALTPEMLAGITMKFDIDALFVRDEFKERTVTVRIPVYSTTETSANEAPADENTEKKSTAAIFFTGGTTGAPKGVILSHGALMRGSFNGALMRGGIFYQRYYLLLPLSHVFGMIRSCLSCLYTGSQVYTCENMQAIFKEIGVIRPTVLILVPGLCELLLGMAKARGKEVLGGELHTIISGAAPVPPRLMAAFKEFNIKLLAGYGLTESANFVCGNMDTDVKPDSVGKLYPEQEIRFVDEEIQLKGDHLFDGYYKDPEATKEAFTEDGWFKTGDLGRMDDEGFIYITGRIKNLIILSNGENVSPEAVEEVFYRDPLVKDCLVSETEVEGAPCIGIEILPYAPLVEGLSPEEVYEKVRSMVKRVNENLPSYMQVATFKVRDTDFERTPSMKIARTLKK